MVTLRGSSPFELGQPTTPATTTSVAAAQERRFRPKAIDLFGSSDGPQMARTFRTR